ncbi:hypothetical protein GCM10008904_16460 [Paraclostridium ghonii]|uniref:Cell wall-binding protein/N-acetylmuramoyl-L-alanine amidase/uncharacterized protein YraI n=1 Tax=Paraclostridium ghonii TaxID=29358 RepID=A0ABU0MWM1_9FIRM|nr:cell wall-binding repeat-containing protein [Paeniclostridium ghonii]MDQ0554901.1 putative cell wall-binding protein/N-acetylmuramoyl-L-alanine amidase/uncharacterized protein YraI [Paeniclostridium ghonii]
MRRRKIVISLLTTSAILLMSSITYANNVEEKKLVGVDRYETAIKVSQEGWKSAETAIIVNSSAIVDALSVTPLANLKNAPILLTQQEYLNKDTKKELQRLGVKNVYIIGTDDVVSEKVNQDIKSMGISTERLGGDDRYETALKIVKKMDSIKDISQIAVVNGMNGLADAVSIASVAASNNIAIVPISPDNGTKAFDEFIQSESISKSYIIGTDDVVPVNIEKKVPNPERLGGIDRNETNAKVISKFYPQQQLNNLYVAKDGMRKQDELVDALSVGVLASKQNAPVAIVGNKVSDAQANVFKDKKTTVLTQVGNEGNENAFNQIKELFSKNTNKIMYVANEETVNVRSGPSINFQKVGELKKGQEIEVIQMLDNGWAKIVFNGKEAYISGSYLSNTKPDDNKETVKIKYVTSETGLNVRKGPSTGDQIIGKLPYGSSVEVVNITSTGWAKIKYNSTYAYAYVSNNYLSDNPVNTGEQKPLPTPKATPRYLDAPQDNRIIDASQDKYQNTIKVNPMYSSGLKSLSIKNCSDFGIEYSAFYNNNWQRSSNGSLVGDGVNNIQGIRINLKNQHENYHVFYRVKDDRGWQAWVKDNKIAGEIGTVNNIKEIQVRIVVSSDTDSMVKPTIAIDIGHNVPRPKLLKGAINGVYDEDYLTKVIGEKMIYKLRSLGYNVIDTLPKSNFTQTDELKQRSNVANLNEVDKMISIHFNSADLTSSEMGTEVLYSNSNGQSKGLAQKIVNRVSNEFNFRNRGANYRDNLYILTNTKAPSVIVEGMFITSKGDMDKFISHGSESYEKMAQSIIEGALN